MGYKNKKYYRDLNQQLNDRLVKMLKAGEGTSKKESIEDGTIQEKIFSYSSYKAYYKHCKYFVDWVKQTHPECKNLNQCKQYVNTWLQDRVDNGGKKGQKLSAWTITLEREALGKLYQIKPDDPNFFKAPERHRHDIKRSRGHAVRDSHFSELNNLEFVEFCKGTGCRRNVLEKLRGRDLITAAEIRQEISRLDQKIGKSEKEEKHLKVLMDALKMFPDQDTFIHHDRDKGGRERYSPVVGEHKDKIIARMKSIAPDEKVWQNVPGNADTHGYRGEYATSVYRIYARPIEEIPFDRINKGTGKKFQSDVYTCRKDEKGKKLDKEAMMKASKALGHNRLEVVANNYLRGL